jgi:hypothetical protein
MFKLPKIIREVSAGFWSQGTPREWFSSLNIDYSVQGGIERRNW